MIIVIVEEDNLGNWVEVTKDTEDLSATLRWRTANQRHGSRDVPSQEAESSLDIRLVVLIADPPIELRSLSANAIKTIVSQVPRRRE